eukprot:COSAG05_NODE_4658_length_1420_cov_36.181681_2_plen_212_part_00
MLPKIGPTLPTYDDPAAKWEAIAANLATEKNPPQQRQSLQPPDSPLSAVQPELLANDKALGAVISALNRDGVCLIRNALPAATALAIHSQMQSHLAAREAAVGLNKQSAGDSGRRAGSVMSRSRASWDAALHPLVMEVCAGVLGRQAREPFRPVLALYFCGTCRQRCCWASSSRSAANAGTNEKSRGYASGAFLLQPAVADAAFSAAPLPD